MQLSVYLMGVYDQHTDKWRTVCRCGNGHNDMKIDELTKTLLPTMEKISQNKNRVPKWLDVRAMHKDF